MKLADDLKTCALAEAEKLARPHTIRTLYHSEWTCDNGCKCGRDAEVQAIAKKLEEFYTQGRFDKAYENATKQ